MTTKTIPVLILIRPYLQIEEISQEDGSKAMGNSWWSAVEFASNLRPPAVVGKYDILILDWEANLNERWEFTDAQIMVSPNPEKKPGCYIVTFDKVKRLSRHF